MNGVLPDPPTLRLPIIIRLDWDLYLEKIFTSKYLRIVIIIKYMPDKGKRKIKRNLGNLYQI